MEPFSALLAICAGNSPVSGEFPAQRLVTWSFDICFDLRLNKRSSKQSWGWWFEMLSCPLWRQCYENPATIWMITLRTTLYFDRVSVWNYTLCYSMSSYKMQTTINLDTYRIGDKPLYKRNQVTGHFKSKVNSITNDNVIKGNIFRVIGLLCGEFTGHRWISITKASDAELLCFLWSAPK